MRVDQREGWMEVNWTTCKNPEWREEKRRGEEWARKGGGNGKGKASRETRVVV